MNFFDYIFYRLYLYYGEDDAKWRSVLVITAVLFSNFLTVLFIISGIVQLNLLETLFTENRNINRFVVLPLIIAPFWLTVHFYFSQNDKFLKIIERFKIETDKEKKEGKIKIISYFILSFVFLCLSTLVGGLLR